MKPQKGCLLWALLQAQKEGATYVYKSDGMYVAYRPCASGGKDHAMLQYNKTPHWGHNSNPELPEGAIPIEQLIAEKTK